MLTSLLLQPIEEKCVYTAMHTDLYRDYENGALCFLIIIFIKPLFPVVKNAVINCKDVLDTNGMVKYVGYELGCKSFGIVKFNGQQYFLIT
jgi:hypothetical protein